MKAFEIQEFGIDKLTQVERPVPECGPRDVLVRMRSASLNFRDVMVVSGTYNPRMRLPAVPVSDGAGEVVEVGAEVSKWAVGDRVCSTVIAGWVDGKPTAEQAKTAIAAGRADGVLQEYRVFDAEGLP